MIIIITKKLYVVVLCVCVFCCYCCIKAQRRIEILWKGADPPTASHTQMDPHVLNWCKETHCVYTFDNVSLHVAAFFFSCSQQFERKKAEEDPVNHISNAVHSLLRYSLSLYIFHFPSHVLCFSFACFPIHVSVRILDERHVHFLESCRQDGHILDDGGSHFPLSK